jgi:two-component system cell cycle response regulator
MSFTQDSPESNRSKIVMGVDDVPENLALLKAYVVAAGYTFFGAASGEECTAMASRIKPRLILLDIEMPNGIDGIETCRRLRRSPDLARVPIAFLTAHKTAQAVMAGMAAGGNDFIAKPFRQDKLIERVRHWTSRRV